MSFIQMQNIDSLFWIEKLNVEVENKQDMLRKLSYLFGCTCRT